MMYSTKTTYATFGIEKTCPNANGAIEKLLIHRRDSTDDSLDQLGWYTRSAIIAHIESGYGYMTIGFTVIAGQRYWNKGADVHVVTTQHGKYLRTDRNAVSCDNLGNLPQC